MITVVHVSDIHFKSDYGRDNAFDLGKRVGSAASTEVDPKGEVFVVVSGDIAYSGKEDEYAIAARFLHGLAEEIQVRRGRKVPTFVIAPGNHDCDHSLNSTARQALIESPKLADPDSASIELCLLVQKHFLKFRSVLSVKVPRFKEISPTVEQGEVDTGQTTICFQIINTAWASQKDEVYGHLTMPDAMLNDNLGATNTDVVVSILHHPYSWFEQNHRRNLRRYVEASSDMVLTGHEHYADVSMISRRGGIRAQYIEGGILSGNVEGEASTFNIVLLDADGKRYKCKTYADDGTGQYSEVSASEWQEYVKNAGRLRLEFELNGDYCNYLSSAGVQYTHPHKPDVNLTDVYVPPTLREKSVDDGEKYEPELYTDLPGLAGSKGRLLVIGAEKSGKTAYAKYMIREMHARGKVPILFKAAKHSIPKNINQYMEKALKKLFDRQYDSRRATEFWLLEPSKRVVIVDDYHKLRLNEAGRDLFLEYLESFADTIVLTAGEEYDYQDISDINDMQHRIIEYHAAEILPFGNVLRGRLIEKWYKLGADYSTDKKSIERAITDAERTVALLLNSNVIPPFPIFVLVVLQQLEANRAPSTESGSMGYLYEFLITEAMAEDRSAKIPLDQKYTYLSVLAKWMYDNKMSTMSESRHATFHDEYKEEYGVAVESRQILSELSKAGILEWSTTGLRFKYKYIRFYFTGRYLAENLDLEAIQIEVKYLAMRLFREDASNIILFLCYLTKNRFVLDTILDCTRQLFAGVPPFSYDADSNAFSELMKHTPQFVMEGTTTERRDKARSIRDKTEVYEVGQARDAVEIHDDDDAENLSEVSDMAKINATFKSMQILGQIVRNAGGALKAERKEEVVRECVALGLRVGAWYSGVIRRGGREFVEMLVEHFLRHDPNAQAAEIESEVKSFLFVCLERTLFVITKKISDAIGLQMLLPTIERVLDVDNSSADALIDLSVRLDYSEHLPFTEAVRLYQSAKKKKKNLLLETLVRHIVWQHLYLYPVSYQTKERICDALRIKKGARLLKSQVKLQDRTEGR